MKFVLNIIADVEDIIIEEVKKYFYEEVRFKELYPNFGNLRVSGTHPIAFLVDQQINNTKLPVGLFPSITIIDDTDQKTPEIPILTPLKDVTVAAAEVSDMEDNREMHSISDKDLQTLKDLTQNDNVLHAEGVETFRSASMVAEIWSENPKIKNKIYDLLIGFLIGIKRFTIKDLYGIVVNDNSIAGEKSGNYNYDFGKILYGGILRFTIDFSIRNYMIDTEIGKIAEVDHYVENVHDKGSD